MNRSRLRTLLRILPAISAFTLFVPGCGGGGSNGSGSGPAAIVSGRAYHEVEGGACCNPPTDTLLPSIPLLFHTISGPVYNQRVVTDASGNYSASLPAGTYAVDLADKSNGPFYISVTPQQIIVTPPTPQQIDIKFIEAVP